MLHLRKGIANVEFDSFCHSVLVFDGKSKALNTGDTEDHRGNRLQIDVDLLTHYCEFEHGYDSDCRR